MTRTDRIDNAVSAASKLIAALMDLGPVTPQQAKLIMVAAANAAVTNIEEFEVRDSAQRVAGEPRGWGNVKISPATCGNAPIVLIYGSEGRGKTTLAAKFPKPLAMLLERGLPAGVKLDAVDGLGAYAAVLESIRELYQDLQGYQTLVIDTLDSLEPLLLEHVCAERNWKNIETPPYGKGYVIADQHWQRFINGITALRDKHNMMIVLVAHSEITRIDDPRAPSFTQYAPKLHKRARALVQDAADVIGFLAEDLKISTDDGGFRERVRASSNNQRFLFLDGCPAYIAKNRFGMPSRVAIPPDFSIIELSRQSFR